MKQSRGLAWQLCLVVLLSVGVARAASAEPSDDSSEWSGMEVGEPSESPSAGTGQEEVKTEHQATGRDASTTSSGWSQPFALLFNLNNPFTNGGWMRGYGGFGAGAQLHLGAQNAIRLGLGLSRSADSPTVTEVRTVDGDTENTQTRFAAPAFTGNHSVALELTYLRRLTLQQLSPYVGGGLWANWTGSQLSYQDAVSVDNQVTTVDGSTSTLAAGVVGVAGAEWRFHRYFSLFAEYRLQIGAFSWERGRQHRVVENEGADDTEYHAEYDKASWFTFNVGPAHTASLGLIVHFDLSDT